MRHIGLKGFVRAAAIGAIALVAACGGNGTSNSNTANEDKAADTTVMTSYVPGTRCLEIDFDIAQMKSYDDYRAFIDSYWDGFDFEAGEAVAAYDFGNICQAFVDYVAFIEPSQADSLLRSLMHRAEASRPVLDLFASVSYTVLFDPNSPMRNDEYYIPILEVLVKSPLLDEYDRIAPAYDLELARKNRIGNIANDFEYTLADGSKHRMHNIEADYLLLMFNNPGCPMCSQLMADITSSPMLNELQELDRLEIISIYPDTDIETWRNYQSEMPTGWISGYDPDQIISQERLYKLNAIPALYLLDADKRVLVKDGSDVRQVEYVIAESDFI